MALGSLVVVGASACESRSPEPQPGTSRDRPNTPPTNDATATQGLPPVDEVIWDRLGAWHGKSHMQTESFTGTTGALRVTWATKNPTAPDGGSFRLTIHSAISGRPLDVAVDQKGPGADVAYVNEDPRVFYAVVDASGLEWSFSVDEPIGTRRGARGAGR